VERLSDQWPRTCAGAQRATPLELEEMRALAAYRERQARGEDAGVPQDEAFRRVFGSQAR
jgi:ribonuclease D